jgi:hypothetical protein
MKYEQDLLIMTRFSCYCQINHNEINISNAQHVTIKINKLVVLHYLNNRYLLKVYSKHLDLRFKLTCRILIGQNIVTMNKTLSFKQYS